ncbi:class II SORL domain-containing protein [Anaerospora sp.]|jgi:superoxide reductase|uniref:class II SORL domain-containing protein n=1 Tax=Anaerospora sp. TaxID=1960278 RepID=UPI00289B43A1|nr:class II SORL domain-containing protein [Anaerospora sp.]MDF2928801.1 putative superoxide reductase [Anaerospora sp.]
MKFAEVMKTDDWKTEKHVPVIDCPDTVKAGAKVAVEVGVGNEIAHPNTTEHHIRWIKLYFMPENGKFAYELANFDFAAHGESVEGANKGPAYTEPFGKALIKLTSSGTLLATAYCNIHGIWENSKKIVVEA